MQDAIKLTDPDSPAVLRTLGRFQCHQLLGRDDVLETYRARILGLAGFERSFSVKCLRPARTPAHAEITRRFLDVAKRLGELKDPHIAQVIDSGVWEGQAFVASEWVYGLDLAALLHLARDSGGPAADADPTTRWYP